MGSIIDDRGVSQDGRSEPGDTINGHAYLDELRKPDTSHWIPILEETAWKPQKVKVISIGAGFSGLTMAYKIQHKYKLDETIDHVIYEKNADIGGTWLENTYIGVMCDVPAHLYTLLDLPNPDWSTFYAPGEEIQQYLRKITKEYHLDRDVHLNSKVVKAIWDEDSGRWNVKVQQGDCVKSDWCHVLINGSGILNDWKWPEIPGLDQFQGHMCHSANWQPDYDFSGKRIAVIGNGSSAIQIVPQLQPNASTLVNYARSPTWISAPYLEDLSAVPGGNPAYTKEEKQAFRDDPSKLREYRQLLTHAVNRFYEGLLEGSPINLLEKSKAEVLMRRRIGDNGELARQLIPTWSFGCRRLTPGNGYLESLSKKNAKLATSTIREITSTGIVTADGQHEAFDVIVCATGFNVSFQPRWLQQGRSGRDLAKEWSQDAKSYFSLGVSGQPNHFIFNGPAAPVAHGSLPSAIDWVAEYILKWVTKMSREDIKSFDVRPDVQDDWNIWGDELLKRTVWASGCSSWYKRNGRITALYPGSILHFKDAIADIRGEDFHITYRSKNRWRCLGNGFTEREVKGGSLAYYIEH